jgi:tellurite resistance protein TerC
MGSVIAVSAVILTLLFLEGVLSIDNAAVIAAMANKLPDNQQAPRPVAWLGRQRSAALKAGLFGAFAGRGLMLGFAGLIIKYPLVHTIGALYLLFLVVEHFTGVNPIRSLFNASTQLFPGNATDDGSGRSGFWSTVLSIELADLAFSIDNVIAAVALSPHLWVVLLGVGLGIITMRFAAVGFQWLIIKVPTMEHGAYLLLLTIAGELLAEQYLGVHLRELHTFSISLTIILGVIAHHALIVQRRRAKVGGASEILDELQDAERLLAGKNID